MNYNEKLALWADKLRDVSAQGLIFSESHYALERYQAIQDIAMEMMAAASGETVEALEPLRGPIFTRPAPIPTADAAIIDEGGRILLIQRSDNRKWAVPGGLLNVGETPAEGAVREALEESGVACEPLALVGVFDSRLCNSRSRHHLYHFVFLCRPLNGGAMQPASHTHEVLDVGWFAEDALPADLDPGHAMRMPAIYRAWHGQHLAYYD